MKKFLIWWVLCAITSTYGMDEKDNPGIELKSKQAVAVPQKTINPEENPLNQEEIKNQKPPAHLSMNIENNLNNNQEEENKNSNVLYDNNKPDNDIISQTNWIKRYLECSEKFWFMSSLCSETFGAVFEIGGKTAVTIFSSIALGSSDPELQKTCNLVSAVLGGGLVVTKLWHLYSTKAFKERGKIYKKFFGK